MSEQTPSQAEGERDDDLGAEFTRDPGRRAADPPRTTPSQAEGERDDADEEERPLPGGADGGPARARDAAEPGAHSGAESRPRDRVVPGTASAAEGYGDRGGTSGGAPLSGVEQTEQTEQTEEG
ncbi:hypothetical protein [Streptomyces cinereospinus]|uniref:D-alanyl-D-alanine carboxypeptidase n=1 Tax=Streptomyces cinereospinus TaxID=285561 RepID=A0ABV5N5B0_9ACTN